MDLMDLRDAVKELPVLDLIESELEWVGKKPLCPFHNDHRPGSFVISKRKNNWTCYACGKKGDAIGFFQERYGMSFPEATTKIAVEQGLVSESELKDLQKTYERKPRCGGIIVREEKKILDSDKLNLAYRLFMKGMTYLKKPLLTETHIKRLKSHYGLTDEEIQDDCLFTWPSSYVAKRYIADLYANGFSDEDFKMIPGLFFNRDTETWDFYRPNNTGAIGVPIRNLDGEVVGFQIRLDKKKDFTSRYQWFSSVFADGKTSPFIHGSSPGSPIDVVYPKELKSAAVFVTEGHFKALKLSHQYGAIVLSVQGVGNWRKIPEVMAELNRRSPALRYVYICYDADMAYKETVLAPALKLGFALTGLNMAEVDGDIFDILYIGYRSEDESNIYNENKAKNVANFLVKNPNHKYIINYCLWDDALGKGIDDLIKSGHIQEIKKMSLIPFWENAFACLRDMDIQRAEISDESEIPFQEVVLTEEQKREAFKKHIFSKL